MNILWNTAYINLLAGYVGHRFFPETENNTSLLRVIHFLNASRIFAVRLDSDSVSNCMELRGAIIRK